MERNEVLTARILGSQNATGFGQLLPLLLMALPLLAANKVYFGVSKGPKRNEWRPTNHLTRH